MRWGTGEVRGRARRHGRKQPVVEGGCWGVGGMDNTNKGVTTIMGRQAEVKQGMDGHDK